MMGCGLKLRIPQILEGKEIKIPQNVFKAVLEVYVSFDESDEFWYGNPPNDHLLANNLTDTAGNGPFREVGVTLDGNVIGNMLDGKTHTLQFRVTNALNVWYIDANLHHWLDGKNTYTVGKLLQRQVIPLGISSSSDFKGLNGTFLTKQTGPYPQLLVNEEIHFDDSVQVKKTYTFSKAKKSCKRFLINLYSNNMDQGNRTYLSIANVTLGFNEKKFGVRGAGYKMPVSSLENLQNGQGIMVVKNNLVVNGVGSTQQKYKYEGNKFCYFRNISSSNYTILNDEVGNACNRSTGSSFGFGFSSRWIPSS
ncbi:hypothetical protein SLEP1_g41661 [Rubroshorea leprosula]|uniref:Peptide N-acetyl-beta-D-glucosaminyl asparaginase amidase A N-terminal domain-containing protein n=1 Tax=Rubroshorea leprosula TaxID=152421 RepID=A0AAV5L7S3_9ROSI|nr:hypothetical protein SLEP1_g41661 [Rubroshorea leprosula]